MKRLENCKIVVTGASRGIGASIARMCAQEGARVAITYSTQKTAADSVLASFPGNGHIALSMNLSSAESVSQTFEQILKEFGSVDGLVNNAGITRDQLLLRMKVEDFDAVIQTNLRGTFLCTREVLKPMMKARKGAIVHITSVVGQTGHGGQANYAASKAGIEAFSKSLAQEMASRGIRSNCVAPGFIETDMTASLTESQREDLFKNIPLGRIATPEEVASGVCFLLSDESRYVTGHTLNVNGGMFCN